NLLAEAVGIKQLVGTDCDRVEPLEQPDLGQFLDGVRQRIDADAELADGVRLLEDFAVDAARMQHQRGYQTANAAAGDNGFHDLLLRPRIRGILKRRLPHYKQCAAKRKKCNDLPLAWL